MNTAVTRLTGVYLKILDLRFEIYTIYKNKKPAEAGFSGNFSELAIKQLQLRSLPEDLSGLQLLRKSLSDLLPACDGQYR